MKLEIKAIKVKDRLREEMGDIDGLAESIKQYGLIHAIVVDDENRLVAGARRLAACKQLQLRVIEARRIGELTAAERREIELEENLHRKDLTAFERSKFTAELKQVARGVAEEEKKTLGNSPRVSGSRGPVPDAASDKSIAEKLNVDRKELRKAEAHVAAAEKYPLLQGRDWSQAAAMRAAEKLDALEAADRRRILSLIEDVGAGAFPSKAETMLDQYSRATPDAREEVWNTARSGDPRDRSMVLSLLAESAPNPDPRAVALMGIEQDVRKLAKTFKDDPFNAEIREMADALKALMERIGRAHKEKIENVMAVVKGGSTR